MPRIRELLVQYRPHPSGASISDQAIHSAALALAVIHPILDQQPMEIFVVLHLNSQRKLLGVQEVSRGGISNAEISIRSILAACIGEKHSSAIILAHNHPSGDPTPSADDLRLTTLVQAACKIFEIDLLDHIIVGDQQYCSLKETGRMSYL